MFEVFFRKYKKTMNESWRESIKEADTFILIVLLCMILSAAVLIFSILLDFDNKRLIMLALGLFILCFVLALIRNKYLLSDSKYLDKIENKKCSRFKKFVLFLNDEKVGLDGSQIDTLIEIARAKQSIPDDSKAFLNGVGGVFKYVLIPIITLIIKDIIDVDDVGQMISRAVILSILSLVFTITITMISTTVKSIFDGNNEKLKELIADLTEVKSFNKQAKEIIENKEKIIVDHNSTTI